MEWKVFFVLLVMAVLLFLLCLAIYDAGKASAYKELLEHYRQKKEREQ